MKKVVFLLLVIVLATVFSACTTFFDKTNKAGLQVITNNVSASIFLDDQYLDKAPYINKELKPNQYVLKIVPDDENLVPYETTITLRKGILTVVTWKPGTRPENSGGVIYELEELSSSKQTELSIVSIPDGAVVSVDDGEKEFSPVLKSDITAGTHDIAISLPSYETQSHTINVVEGHRLNVLVKLAKNTETSEDLDTTSASDSANQDAKQTDTSKTDTSDSSTKDVLDLKDALNIKTVTILKTDFFQNGVEVLRVRNKPSAAGAEVGFAIVGDEYPYVTSEKDWYQIDFDGQEGWVSSKYASINE